MITTNETKRTTTIITIDGVFDTARQFTKTTRLFGIVVYRHHLSHNIEYQNQKQKTSNPIGLRQNSNYNEETKEKGNDKDKA